MATIRKSYWKRELKMTVELHPIFLITTTNNNEIASRTHVIITIVIFQIEELNEDSN